ncbi:hypothetical protein [Desertimonas flava]|uniref:hypothetical protein n=1 Tax=Desertimonas flava TaxID=2064846 RepID=UPI0013C46342|nr:hypothetical protein [Desertimonas flava]
MLAPHEIESLRRSAAMAPLKPSDLDRLFTAAAEMAAERAAIAKVLDELPASFGAVRAALNELKRIVG